MNEGQTDNRAGVQTFARKIIELWALLGGLILLAVVLMSSASVTGNALMGTPFPGDFEIVQMGVAISVFCFLPYCQMTGANVTADIFTSGASPRTIALLGLLASIIAIGFSLLLLSRMWAGMYDYIKYEETTAILQVPHWWAFIPILISLVLLAVASILTLVDSAQAVSAYKTGSL
ncbi:MAG: TRAP transporter small permease [Rhizobiaceae bacterium]|nr:TRAP transporter small permease [Rhizobiaceae bacterium]